MQDEKSRKVMRWIQYAEEDIKLAEHSLTLESSCPYRLTAYHAQQCVEKYLKAVLVHHQIDFPYTHSITRLLELLQPVLSSTEYSDAEMLSAYAITTRYPGEDEEVTKDEAVEAIKIAKTTVEQIRSLMKW
ncbi:MAG: HEPN domain-containing protein [Ignavibacteria bacterium]|nr:MAG: HEPN domain-containing protein [Ignavibacteria bacterium]KAF0160623.1 MAG: HEPN domain-containing protein [Ignavibacteria bacterium]